METLSPWTAVPPTTAERQELRRREVRASLQGRIREAQMAIDTDLLPEMERLHYEREIVRRLLAKAQDEGQRQDWEIEESVLHDVAVMRTADLEEQQQLIDRYTAMIAEIDADEAAA